VHLISDGRDRQLYKGLRCGARFEGMDSSGGNVFFRTADRLVPQDGDSQVDLYDARVDGGFPAPASSAACEGEACQGAPAAAPVFGAPGSSTFPGGGNLVPPAPVKPKPLTSAEKLTKALKACHAKHNKRKRASCERSARKKYSFRASKSSGIR
jgi:hypothetical protein